jgi:hypothetical protein
LPGVCRARVRAVRVGRSDLEALRSEGVRERREGPTPVRARPLLVLGREKAVEERTIALKSDAKVFSRDFVTAIPLALQPFSLFGE